MWSSPQGWTPSNSTTTISGGLCEYQCPEEQSINLQSLQSSSHLSHTNNYTTESTTNLLIKDHSCSHQLRVHQRQSSKPKSSPQSPQSPKPQSNPKSKPSEPKPAKPTSGTNIMPKKQVWLCNHEIKTTKTLAQERIDLKVTAANLNKRKEPLVFPPFENSQGDLQIAFDTLLIEKQRSASSSSPSFSSPARES